LSTKIASQNTRTLMRSLGWGRVQHLLFERGTQSSAPPCMGLTINRPAAVCPKAQVTGHPTLGSRNTFAASLPTTIAFSRSSHILSAFALRSSTSLQT